MKNYFCGLRAEDRLAGALTRLGHTASYYENSSRGRRLFIQVRSTRRSTVRIPDSDAAFAFISSRLSDVDLARLSKHAMKTRGKPAVGLTHGDYYWTWRVRAARDEYTFALIHHGWLPKRSLARSEVS